MNKDIKKFAEYIKEEIDTNVNVMKNNVDTYSKYKSKVTTFFSNAKAEDMEKIGADFDTFINSLPDNEKGASDMLRTLYSSEKIKFDIKSLETKKQEIDTQIQQRMKELQEISNNIK